MRAKKLPSGSWRCLVYLGTVDGKRKYKSVTVDDPTPAGRRKCEKMASDLAAQRERTAQLCTVDDAIGEYIEIKEKTLSPSTITAYKAYRKSCYIFIGNFEIMYLSDKIVQDWIDGLAKIKSPKTVKNAYGLFKSACKRKNVSFNVSLPDRKEPDLYTPTDGEIKKLLKEIKGTELEKAVMLAAFGTLRRGEICALTYGDIKGNVVEVNKALAWNGSEYVLKAPKTLSSNRSVTLPKEVIKVLTDDSRKVSDHVVSLHPHQVSMQFYRTLKRLKMHPFRFHDLRAYAVSIRHAMGIPDQYIMADGGYATDYVMKRVYRRAMEDKRKAYSEKTNEHFSNLLS